MINKIPANNNAIAIDINNGDAFSGEFKKLTIQMISSKTAMSIIINEKFLSLLSNLSNSSIVIKIRIFQLKFIFNLI